MTRLAEIAFGEWEGLTYADVLARDQRRRRQARVQQVELSCRPAVKATRRSPSRMRQWYETVAGDTVVAAHGGTARALIAHLGIAPPEEATHYSIDQGVVYVFGADGIARYA